MGMWHSIVTPVQSMVVLVNGLPAAGKSTLADGLAAALRLPLLSKDLIKEAHADVLGTDPPPGLTQRDWNRKLGTAASETMWALLAQSTPGAVLESSWRADVRGGWSMPVSSAPVSAALPRCGARRRCRSDASGSIDGGHRRTPSTALRPTTASGPKWSSTQNRWASGRHSASTHPARSILRLSSSGANPTRGLPRGRAGKGPVRDRAGRTNYRSAEPVPERRFRDALRAVLGRHFGDGLSGLVPNPAAWAQTQPK